MALIELGSKNPKRIVAVYRRVAFVALTFLVSTTAFESKRSVVPLIFGVLICAVMLYEHGVKKDANRRNLIWFIAVYLAPMALMIFFVGRRLLNP
jgi:hypothetical protein